MFDPILVAHLRLQVDLCPVTSTDQWKNCAREAHRDSITSTYFANVISRWFSTTKKDSI